MTEIDLAPCVEPLPLELTRIIGQFADEHPDVAVSCVALYALPCYAHIYVNLETQTHSDAAVEKYLAKYPPEGGGYLREDLAGRFLANPNDYAFGQHAEISLPHYPSLYEVFRTETHVSFRDLSGKVHKVDSGDENIGKVLLPVLSRVLRSFCDFGPLKLNSTFRMGVCIHGTTCEKFWIHGAAGDNTDDDIDDAGDEPQVQEYIYYFNDKCLGSYFIKESEPESDPIERCLLKAPAILDVSGKFGLRLTIDGNGKAKVVTWIPADSDELVQAKRLYDRCHPGDRDAELAAAYKPVKRPKQEQQLLQAIRDDFENDTPLNEYADWLSSKGNAQGEFIRVTLDRLRTRSDDASRNAASQRCDTLLEEHGDEWFQPLSDLNIFPDDRADWIKRGIISKVEISRPTLLTIRAAELFDAVPLLRTLEFDCKKLNVADLATIPQTSQIAELDLRGLKFNAKQLKILFDSPYLTSLRTLNLAMMNLDAKCLRSLVASGVWKQIRSLLIYSCGIDDDGIELIATGDEPVDLQVLDLNGNAFSSRGLRALGMSKSLVQLKSLDISEVRLTSSSIGALGKAVWVPQLESLTLQFSKINAKTAAQIANWPVTKLRSLDLGYSALKDEALMNLLDSSLLENVEELDLSDNSLTDVGIAALAKSARCTKVSSLKLRKNRFGAKGISAITASRFLTKLRWLEFSNDDGVIPDSQIKRLYERFGRKNVLIY